MCVLNRMPIDTEKSRFLVFGKPKNMICLKLGDDIMSHSNNIKLLDFYLSDPMTWNEHVEKLVAKLQSTCNLNLIEVYRNYIIVHKRVRAGLMVEG